MSLTGSAKGRVVERGSDLDHITAEKGHVQSELILPCRLTNIPHVDRFCCGGWACGEVVRSAALPSCPLIHRPGLGRVEAGHAAWSLSSSMVSPSAR